MGESVAYPSYAKIVARLFPEQRRGFANAVIAAGLAAGPGVGLLFGGVLMARFGWRPFFVVLGSVSLLWLLPWARFMPSAPPVVSSTSDGPGYREILGERSLWATSLCLFCANYSLYFMTAIDAYQRDWEVILAADCIGSYDREHHEVSLRYMRDKIAEVLSNSEIANRLDGGSTE